MLDPNNRRLLTEAIAAEPGYRLDHALFTTFTLDLITLMEIPVALTFQEWQAKDPDSGLSRIAVLDAIRRHVGNLTVVSQAGSITGPAKGHPLLPLLEPAIHPIVMPPHSTFHPKVTLLRYLADQEAIADGEDEVTYKLICSSRNLSASRAWDTIVVLDGTVTNRRQADAKGLSKFVSGAAALAGDSPTGLEQNRAEALEQMAEEAPRIAFERPEEVKEGKGNLEMVPIGFGSRYRPRPIRSDQKRLLVTPFLGGPSDESRGDRLLETFASENTVLVSRQGELDRVPESLLEKFGEVMVLSDLAQVTEAEDDSAEEKADDQVTTESELSGLHAKLIVEDDGFDCRILIGSPNFSERAFSDNLEFAVRLTVSKKRNGVEKILGTEDKSGLRRFLQHYVRSDSPDEEQAEIRAAERSLEKLAAGFLRADLALRISAASGEQDDHRDLWLEPGQAVDPIPDGFSVEARPVTLGPDRNRPLESRSARLVEWETVPLESITSLIAIRVSTTVDGKKLEQSFVAKVRLADPLPEARDRLIIRRLIDSSNQLLNYLAFLLSGSGDPSAALELVDQLDESSEPGRPQGIPGSPTSRIGLPLMEKMVQAVDRDPEAIDSISAIVEELKGDEKGREILNDAGFANIWKPILAARKRRNEVRR